jgi:F0F1-type ATP synthase assembly protein I
MSRPGLTDAWAQVAFYIGLSFIVPVSAVAGYFLGAYLDRHLHTGSVLAIIGVFAGAAAGIADLIHIVTQRERHAGKR